MYKTAIVIFVLILIAGFIWFLESRKADIPDIPEGSQDIVLKNADERVFEKSEQFERAKEISTPDGFINIESDGITIEELIGKKVILVDFWTYSCINCQRTTPYLNLWYEKYADQGFEILGLHTPEFDFEKDYDNVVRATEKFGIEYPVILDNDYSTWRAYKNQYWPRKYLIDIDGFIVYDHIGEGAYEETEAKIIELLNERSVVLGEQVIEASDSAPQNIDEVDFKKVGSPEMYLGYARAQYIGNDVSGACIDTSCSFDAPNEIQLNTFYFDGDWTIHSEYSELDSSQGQIVLGFSASKVNFVSGVMEGEVEAEIYLDGKRVDASNRGIDVEEDGKVRFSEHDLYNLIDLKGEYEKHILLIKILNGGIQGFAFTFG